MANDLIILHGQFLLAQVGWLSAAKRKQFLENNMPADETVSAWCADLTEDLAGIVGTIEIPGESKYIQIQPGYDSNAVYSRTRDGQLLPTGVATAAQAFYNLAMMPGWQKWEPLFRYGTITAIDGGIASVVLEDIRSSQQSININRLSSLSDVPIEYMNCDGGAFEVDDSVLIKFTNQLWANPVIIGFKDNPKTCVYYITWTDLIDPVTPDVGNFNIDIEPEYLQITYNSVSFTYWRFYADIEDVSFNPTKDTYLFIDISGFIHAGEPDGVDTEGGRSRLKFRVVMMISEDEYVETDINLFLGNYTDNTTRFFDEQVQVKAPYPVTALLGWGIWGDCISQSIILPRSSCDVTFSASGIIQGKMIEGYELRELHSSFGDWYVEL